MLKSEISRRTFLKSATAAGVTAVAFGGYTTYDKWSAQAANTDSKIEVKATLCNGCTSACGVLVHLKNGRLWRLTGHPDHPYSLGTICARGQGAASWLYHPDRLSQPLKRVGGGKFEPISWEQAFTEIGQKLKEILRTHGPEAVYYNHNQKTIGDFYGVRFAHAMGVSTIMTHHVMCSSSKDTGLHWTIGDKGAFADISRSKYVIFIGRSYGDGIRPASVKTLAAAKEAGKKIVIVDPRYNNTVPLANEWLPIRPGTDLAFLLAMAHVIIKENLHDAKFVEEKGVGFDRFAEEMKQYTPEWAEKITQIPAETIARIAREFASAKPRAVIEQSWKGAFGCNYVNSTETARMVGLLNALIGNLNRHGGLTLGIGAPLGDLDAEKHPSPKKPKTKRVDEVGPGEKYPTVLLDRGIAQLAIRKAAEGKAKAAIIRHYNPARSLPDREKTIQGLKNLELLVVLENFMSETAELAHYVLPEPSYLERTELVESLSGWKPPVTMRNQVVDKIHPETKPFEEIITGLAKAMGYGQYFNFTLEELNRARLAPLGITLEELQKKGVISLSKPVLEEGSLKLKTPSGKVEFFSQTFADAGYPGVPKWIPPLVTLDPKKPNEFRLTHGKQGIHSHTSTTNIPMLLQISKDYGMERLWMNKSKAQALGINDGDTVIMESKVGSGKVKVKLTERVHPETVFLPSHYGSFAKSRKVGNHFGLSVNDFVEYMIEPMSGAVNAMEVLVSIRKEG